jgi:RNA polymerase sigma-70 factor (ECF subfamily)
VRASLCDDAIGLGRLLSVLLPDEPEVLGLAALMLFHDDRRSTRTTAAGLPVPLDEQDRARWNRAEIAEGDRLLERALTMTSHGPYVIQACIASLHSQAPSASDTDWRQITELYRVLRSQLPSPTVELAYAGAIGMAEGPEVGLAVLDDLRCRGWDGDPGRLATLRGELLRRAGHPAQAAGAYRDALSSGPSAREREYLIARLAELERPQPASR